MSGLAKSIVGGQSVDGADHSGPSTSSPASVSYPMARPRAGAAKTNVARRTVGPTAMITPTTLPTLAPAARAAFTSLWKPAVLAPRATEALKRGEGARLEVEVAAGQLKGAFGQGCPLRVICRLSPGGEGPLGSPGGSPPPLFIAGSPAWLEGFLSSVVTAGELWSQPVEVICMEATGTGQFLSEGKGVALSSVIASWLKSTGAPRVS